MEDNRTTIPAQEPPPVEETLAARPKRSNKWFFIGAGVVVFLALAAFLGAQLLRPKGAANLPGGGGMFLSSKGGPGGAKSVRVNMTPAQELPKEKPSAAGLFVRREDQSIFIGTGNIRMTISKGANGSATPSGSYDGPVVEAVITHDTKIYQDITDMDLDKTEAQNGGVMTVQQKVKPGSLDDLGANQNVTVWGDKQGDRYIAKVIVYR